MTLYMKEQEIREEAWEEAWEEARKNDIKIVVEMLKSFNIQIQAISEQLMERFDLTKDEADSFINQK